MVRESKGDIEESIETQNAASLRKTPFMFYAGKTMPSILHFECSKCGEKLDASKPQTLCTKCAGVLYVRYDMDALRKNATRDSINKDVKSMWRYANVLPNV